jgi:APA family basic amino acid/polyamine antiporter
MKMSEVFVRKASGLVRGMSGIDALVGNMLVANLVFGSVGLLSIPSTWAGADLVWSVIFSTIGATFVGIVYWLLGSTFPLSGGDYVFNSRIIHPATGFAFNVSAIFWAVLFLGVYGNWSMTIGLSGFLANLGVISNNPGLVDLSTFVASPNITFTVATIINIVIAMVVVTGLKPSMLAQKIFLTVGMIGVVVAILVLAATSHQAFVARFNAFTDYDKVIRTALDTPTQGQGFPVLGNWNDLNAALMATGFSSLTVLYTQYNVYAGGELRNPKKNMFLAIIGSILVLTPLVMLMAYGLQFVVGSQFLGSLYYLFYSGANPLPVPPSLNFFASIVAPNQFLLYVMGIGFVLWPLGTIIFVYTIASRSMMAWSFDRILPDKISQVNSRFRTPTYAILACLVLSEISLYLYTYSVYFATFVAASVVGIVGVYGLTCVAGMILPWRRKDLYKGSPADIKVGGIPLIVIGGLGGVIFMAFMMYGTLTNQFAGVWIYNPVAVLSSLIFIILGYPIFYISKLIRKRQGIDLDQVYKEIPPA